MGLRFFIDRGGTFTDVLAVDKRGQVYSHKLLSQNPERYADAVYQGIQDILATSGEQDVLELRLGTTVGTNALLERKGARTAFVTTRGFADALKIGYQNRPDLFALEIITPAPLYQTVIEIDERISAEGRALQKPDLAKAEVALAKLLKKNILSLAISFVHGYKYPRHEKQIARLAKRMGFKHVVTSHEVSPLIKFIRRADTTVLEAYLGPVIESYTRKLKKQVSPAPFYMMQSNGGLIPAQSFAGKDSLLSGPAGGVVGGVQTARRHGFNKVIGFDMGGTSTDVWHWAGRYERIHEETIAGVRLQVPMLEINTIAAGGGSILSSEAARPLVGPESAGADPGPACYRRGGPLTVTDANVLLGRIQGEYFPRVFGPGADQPLDHRAVTSRFKKYQQKYFQQPIEEIATGYLEVANEKMAEAIREISTRKGHNLQNYVLQCFGGAAGLHGCDLAEHLGMKKVFIHQYAGVLSALGMGLANRSMLREFAVGQKVTPELNLGKLQTKFEAETLKEAAALGLQNVKLTVTVGLHYQHSESFINLGIGSSAAAMLKKFAREHQRLYGFKDSSRPVFLSYFQVEAMQKNSFALKKTGKVGKRRPARATSRVKVYTDRWQQVNLFLVKNLKAGDSAKGPCLIAGKTETIYVKKNWSFQKTGNGLLLEPVKQLAHSRKLSDAFMLEVFHNAFGALASQMGTVLQAVSRSVNIRERLDFSCALFDERGDLIANAPHIPVHLGSMSESVKAVISKHKGQIKPGDVFLTNNPFAGGTHLPDITVITPAFLGKKARPDFYLASRGHHADVGGITPGSMPATSNSLFEEGVVIDSERIVIRNRLDVKKLNRIFSEAQYASRNVEMNIADIKAQIAANARGLQELQRLSALYSLNQIKRFARLIFDNARLMVLENLKKIKGGTASFKMDSGARVSVSIKKKDKLVFDFSNSSLSEFDNSNTPAAIIMACVLYVIRLLMQKAIPLNAGCLQPVEIILPSSGFLNPQYGAAVVAGNVETSQTIVDTLLAALGVMASSQGTMNNLTFGNETQQYYETLCGGTGAGPGFQGHDAVHSHMTNSRLTDVEILEARFNVRLLEFKIRKNSGGKGRFNGGNGIERALQFLDDFEVQMLSNRRSVPPAGLKQGGAAAAGRNLLIRAGKTSRLAGTFSIEVQKNDILKIYTPGGGGWGRPREVSLQ